MEIKITSQKLLLTTVISAIIGVTGCSSSSSSGSSSGGSSTPDDKVSDVKSIDTVPEDNVLRRDVQIHKTIKIEELSDNTKYSIRGIKEDSPLGVDFSALPDGLSKYSYTGVRTDDEDGDLDVDGTFYVYNQPYSVIIGTKEDDYYFDALQVKGLKTGVTDAIDKLTAEKVTATYKGKGFNLHKDNMAFSYTIDFAKETGSGSLDDIILHEANIKASVVRGASTSKKNYKYDLDIFGPNAEEVAGKVYAFYYAIDGDENLGTIFAGKRETN